MEVIASHVREAGGRACLVGGCVRDQLLGRPVKDWDVEVYGLPRDQLEKTLRRLGRVDAVGRSFGVFKSRPAGWRGEEIDVSIPRRDSKVGPGHRGIAVEGDPHMSVREACRRRDLTINAILFDLHTQSFVDPWGGIDDMERRILRPVDEETFLEDPLRALRAAQFAARLGFEPTEDLTALCRRAPLDELPAERIQGEWEKLLLKGVRPSTGLAFAADAAIDQRVFPEATAAAHPTASQLLDALVSHRDAVAGRGRKWALMLGGWLYGTTSAVIETTLDRLWLHRVERYDLRPVVHALAALTPPAQEVCALRRLSTRVELDLALRLLTARGHDMTEARRIATDHGIVHSAPPPLVLGRDLLRAGIAPGPQVGVLLRAAYDAQLDGDLQDADDALAFVLARASAEAKPS